MKHTDRIRKQIRHAIEQQAEGFSYGLFAGVASAKTVDQIERIALEEGWSLRVQPARHRVSATVRGYDVYLGSEV